MDIGTKRLLTVEILLLIFVTICIATGTYCKLTVRYMHRSNNLAQKFKYKFKR